MRRRAPSAKSLRIAPVQLMPGSGTTGGGIGPRHAVEERAHDADAPARSLDDRGGQLVEEVGLVPRAGVLDRDAGMLAVTRLELGEEPGRTRAPRELGIVGAPADHLRAVHVCAR